MQKKNKIIIIGNGFGGTYTLKNLHKLVCGKENIDITLVGERNYFLFTPLLHEVATGSINKENIVEPIRKIFDCCISNFYLGKVDEINIEKQIVKIKDNVLDYDYLVLAPGAETNFYGINGAEENSFTLKSIEDAIKIKNHIIHQIEKASHIEDKDKRRQMLTFGIVGGGPTGVELAMELQEFIQDNFIKYYNKEIIQDAKVILIQKIDKVLPQFNKKIQDKSLLFLKKKGVEVLLNTEVIEVGPDYLMINNNKKIQTEMTIWVAGIKPAHLKFDIAIEKLRDGRLLVNQYLQLEKYENIFALGDVSAFKNGDNFLPALAQVAEKQAEAVARNIYLSIENKKLEPFVYKHRGNLISLGQWMAIGEISNFTFSGRIAWWIWRTVYLSKLISFNKKLKVATDWTVNLFSPRDISKL